MVNIYQKRENIGKFHKINLKNKYDGTYSIPDIQDYFESIITKT